MASRFQALISMMRYRSRVRLIGSEGRGGLVDHLGPVIPSGDQGDRLGQGQGGPLAIGEERRLSPGTQGVEPLFRLTLGAGVLECMSMQ